MVQVPRKGNCSERLGLAGDWWGRGGAGVGQQQRRRGPLLLALAATILLLIWLPPGTIFAKLRLNSLTSQANAAQVATCPDCPRCAPTVLPAHDAEALSSLSAVAQEMLPQLQRRPDQLALEARWGAAPVLAPQPGALAGMKIPRILHHVYFPNIEGFLKGGPGKEALAQSCRRMHPGWQYVFWDWEAAQELVNTRYPEYSEMFASLDQIIKRADAIRYFIMHAIGGWYIDMDVECFAPVDSWMAGYDVVLQDPGPTNGVVASVPGHPLWMAAVKLMKERWQEDPNRYVVELTGPGLLSSTFKDQGLGPKERPGQADPWSGLHRFADSDVMVYPQGEFFHPCEWNDGPCHRDITIQRALGTANLTRLAGYHRFAASWWEGGGGVGISSEEALKKQLCG